MSEKFVVVKPNRFGCLWHFANEGFLKEYGGLHQWDFDVKGKDFEVSDGRRQVSVSLEFERRATLECEVTAALGRKVVIAKLRKLTAAT